MPVSRGLDLKRRKRDGGISPRGRRYFLLPLQLLQVVSTAKCKVSSGSLKKVARLGLRRQGG